MNTNGRDLAVATNGMIVFRDDPHDPGLRAILTALRPQCRAALDLGCYLSPRWGEQTVEIFNKTAPSIPVPS